MHVFNVKKNVKNKLLKLEDEKKITLSACSSFTF